MVEITLPIILQLLQTAGILVGIIYYITIMRNTQKARKTEMLTRLHESKHDIEGLQTYFTLLNTSWQDFDDYRQRYGRLANPEYTAIMESQMSFYDGLGVLLRDNMVDLNTVYSIMGRRIMSVWVKFETVIKGMRGVSDGPGPDYCENFEYLADEILKIRRQKGLPIYQHHIHPTSTQFNVET